MLLLLVIISLHIIDKECGTITQEVSSMANILLIGFYGYTITINAGYNLRSTLIQKLLISECTQIILYNCVIITWTIHEITSSYLSIVKHESELT